MSVVPRLSNFIGGVWCTSAADDCRQVVDPGTAQVLADVPLSTAAEVNTAIAAAVAAYPEWQHLPAGVRTSYLFRFHRLLLEHADELAAMITRECGKTLAEAKGEVQRGIENTEMACAAPLLLQGYNNEDIVRGIDEHMFRQPLGVVAAVTPFNFPAMIPLWFLPYAIACGNCFILKPSERVPLTSVRLFELLHQTGLPAGVAQLVHGGQQAVDVLIDHPDVRAISFVGSTGVARQVYARAAANGKRVQCQGGAKNPAIVLPDADIELTTQIVADSAFGCAGQRCLASSLAIAVGEAGRTFTASISEAAASRRVGYGLEPGVEMGPVISSESRVRIEQLIGVGTHGGASVRVDGRGKAVSGFEEGYFLHPTVLDELAPDSEIARTEIFGPVLGMIRVDTLDRAIELVNSSRFGNMACLFTTSGAAARKFRREALAGNIGINVGVAAPMAGFPFSGWKDSFFGDLHAQGRHAVEFYTQTKVVVERWPGS
jgi:malonate-semialdehyde dehydrogenase (acetylating) / methylmalonate-semialdehyde dehydrogenase